MNPFTLRHARGFSLLELLTVLAILGMLAALLLPALTSINHGSSIRVAGERTVGLLSLARQKAITENRPMELHFMELQDDTVGTVEFRGAQIFARREDGQLRPVIRFEEFPAGAMIDPAEIFSSLLRSNAMHEVALIESIPGRSVTSVRSLVFFPDGSTSLPDHAGNYFLTIRHRNATAAEGAPAANFFCIQVDPANGHARVYQP